MRTILHCSRNAREARLALLAAKDDGMAILPARMIAILPSLDVQFMFRVFERPQDAEEVRGMELAGVVGLWTVHPECRDHILARVRP